MYNTVGSVIQKGQVETDTVLLSVKLSNNSSLESFHYRLFSLTPKPSKVV